MAVPTRVYRVTEVATHNVRLVRGPTKAQVRAYASRNAFDVEVASQNELIALLQSGVKVEDAALATQETEQPESN
jgi:hypothetical protein